MTPKFDVRGIVAGHFCKNPQEYGEENTAKASYDEVIRMMELMGIEGEYPVALGASRGMEDEQTPVESEGARFIIEEALKVDERPLESDILPLLKQKLHLLHEYPSSD